MVKVFVDGQEGTTGLQINDYLEKRKDLEILKIEQEERKNPERRSFFLNSADIVFLCLPDAASREAVSLVSNPKTRIIDASTAYRTDDQWTYGMPELNPGQRAKIKAASRVANPGCHATGFVLSMNPLVQTGIVPKDYPVVCYSLTGYSGGGKKLIQTFENSELESINSPKHYALQLHHKHLPEMQKAAGLSYPPAFMPVIANYYKGMVTSIPLLPRLLNKKVTVADVKNIFTEYYQNEPFVKVMASDDSCLEKGYMNAEACNGTNRFEIFVYGNDEQIVVMARFDNLGKGASGAAIQNMNIMLGAPETTGLMV
ncbi:MAG: N-acetyl-gamma-glutamyl-phosphate reductase [Thermoclostridium sp.]|nr:N-acetyl-gamma-glutamyl-phosphate reductase [Thermoclostridium sp.]